MIIITIIIIVFIIIIIITIIILFSAYFPLYKNNFSWCSLLWCTVQTGSNFKCFEWMKIFTIPMKAAQE